MDIKDFENFYIYINKNIQIVSDRLFAARTHESKHEYKKAVLLYYNACILIYDIIFTATLIPISSYIDSFIISPLENKLFKITERMNHIFQNNLKGILDLKRVADQLYLKKDPIVALQNREESSQKGITKFLTVMNTDADKYSFHNIIGHVNIKGDLQNLLYSSDQLQRIGEGLNLNFNTNGILLNGPPGTGKTSLAAALAHENDSKLYIINTPEILSSYLGETEKNIQNLFKYLESETTNSEKPKVVFFDEIDSLMRKRSSTDSDHVLRVKNVFMVSLDNILKNTNNRLIFMFATNFGSDLDEAFLRRLTKIYNVDRPQSIEEYAMHLNNLFTKVNVSQDVKNKVLSLVYNRKLSQADLKRMVSIATIDKIYDSLMSSNRVYVSNYKECANKTNIYGNRLNQNVCKVLGNKNNYTEINEINDKILAPILEVDDFNRAINKLSTQ